MPVSTGSTSNTLQQYNNNNNNQQQSTNNQSTNDEPKAKRCKHCDDASHRSVGGGDSQGGLWRIPLDADLLATIAAVYPDWFKEKQPTNNNNNNITNGNNNNNNIHNMADGGGGGGGASSGNGATSQQQPPQQNSPPPDSPPKAIVDTSPLQNAMDKNKESLKVKLMLRRPINQLVAQGIMPPLKTPPAYHEQRRQLERAKTGDILQKKIQQRPSRSELEQRHILDSQSKVPVDPSLADRQRMLKKARLADQLNDQLSHRPGPLELIQKNILHTEEPIEQAVKAGKIPFKATCEGQATRPQHPNSYVSVDDDSQSSEGGSVSTNDVIESAAKSAGIVVSLVTPTQNTVAPVTTASFTFAELCKSVTAAAGLLPLAPAPSPAPSSSMSPLSSLASPQTPQTPLTPRTQPSPAPGKDKNRKKSKLKSAPKTRTIKFHEYKGPPNAQKNSSSANNNNISNETSYELLLQQQQLFLQWQLEWQHKYPQIILPATQKNPDTDSCSNSSIPNGSPPSSVSSTVSEQQTQVVNVVPKPLGRLEDKKVSDLKAELKKRNLPVSGSKPQLIERLRPFTEPVTHSGHIIMDTPPPPTPSAEESQEEDSHSQASPASDMGMDIVPESPAPPTNEDIVREQQRKIEELQRELTKSQLQLQQVRDGVQSTAGQKLQHYVRARQDLKRQQHAVFQNAKNVAVANGLSAGVVLNGPQAALILNQLQKAKLVANGQTANFIVPAAVITTATTTTPQELLQQVTQQQNQLQQLQQSQQMQQNQQQLQQNHQIQQTQQIQQSQQLQQQEMQTAQQTQVASPMSNQFTEDQPSLSPASNSELENNNIKSQIVDDIFEILIKNGELPPNAANEILIKNGELPVNPVNESVLPNHHDSHDSLQNGVPSPQSINGIVPSDTVPSSPHSPLAGLDELLHANSNDDLKDLAHDLDTFFDFPTLDSDQTSQNKEQHDTCNMKFNCNSPDVEFDCNSQDVKFGCDPTTVKFGQPDMKFDNMADIKFECNTSDINFNCNSPDNQNLSDVKFGCNMAGVKFGHNINEMKFGQDSINHNQNSISSPDELMDVDMGMDMDEDGQDWLGSLIPSEPSSVPIQTLNMSSLMQTQSLCNDFSIPAGYDPLLGHSLHDPLDFFGLDEFRTNGDLQSNNNSTPMSWDKLDFAA